MPGATRNETLSITRLREVLDFDPEVGIFTWKVRLSRGVRVGQKAGSLDFRGYRYIKIDGKDYLSSRLAWFWVHERWPRLTRFQNEDRDDCRISNLCEGFYLTTRFDFSTAEGRSAYQKEYRSTQRERFRGEELKRRFGIDLAEYQRLFVEQKGVCAICEQPERGTRNGKAKWLAVDHCHDTGAVRGLLCSNCNPMIGYARENIGTLMRAVAYLQCHSVADETRDNVVVMPRKETA